MRILLINSLKQKTTVTTWIHLVYVCSVIICETTTEKTMKLCLQEHDDTALISSQVAGIRILNPIQPTYIEISEIKHTCLQVFKWYDV